MLGLLTRVLSAGVSSGAIAQPTVLPWRPPARVEKSVISLATAAENILVGDATEECQINLTPIDLRDLVLGEAVGVIHLGLKGINDKRAPKNLSGLRGVTRDGAVRHPRFWRLGSGRQEHKLRPVPHIMRGGAAEVFYSEMGVRSAFFVAADQRSVAPVIESGRFKEEIRPKLGARRSALFQEGVEEKSRANRADEHGPEGIISGLPGRIRRLPLGAKVGLALGLAFLAASILGGRQIGDRHAYWRWIAASGLIGIAVTLWWVSGA